VSLAKSTFLAVMQMLQLKTVPELRNIASRLITEALSKGEFGRDIIFTGTGVMPTQLNKFCFCQYMKPIFIPMASTIPYSR